MSIEPPDEYKLAALKLLDDAIKRRDGKAGIAVIEMVRGAGYGEWANGVMKTLILSAGVPSC